MNYLDLIRAGRLNEALQAAMEQVRQRPADAGLRSTLFDLFALTGQWDRATNQLKVLESLDAETLLFSRLYLANIEAELFRQRIFCDSANPVIFGEPEPWMADQLQGIQLGLKGKMAEAGELLQRSLDAAPTVKGNLNGQPFQWIADADLRFGAMLEAVIEGKYYWVPFFRIRRLRMEAPKSLRDLIWQPAGFLWAKGGEAAGFVITRYPGTEKSDDDQLRTCAKTEWISAGDRVNSGLGQRLLASEKEDFALLEIRTMEFDQTVVEH